MSTQDDKFAFITEWYDPNAGLNRRYQLFYYATDNSIEMFDIKNHRTFLRRSKTELGLEELYLGSTVNVFSRQLKFVDYADEYTRRKLSQKTEKTLGLIKPDGIGKLGSILDLISKSGFLVTKLKMCRISRNEAMEFYREHQSQASFNQLLETVCRDRVVAMELMGEGAIQKWRDFLGPTDSSVARSEAPTSLRARFGKDGVQNACHGSDSAETAARELEFFFPCSGQSHPNTAVCNDSTCCVIKPHAVASGLTGQILCKILDAGFDVTAMQMFSLEQANAEEFLEVYKGVVQEYPQMVGELTSGPCVAMEIRAQDAARAFREMVGPTDPEIARHLRPRTLRAQFGKNKIQNALHCTDLPEDGILEVEYFFKILDH